MRVLKGDSPITPEDLQAVARGCPLAVLAEMVQEFEQSPSDGPLTNHQENMNLGGALISPIPDWQEKAGWLLRRMPCGPALSLDHPSAQEFARLPDAQQRLDWLAEAAPGLRYYDDRICWAAEAGRADLVMKLWYPPTEEALQDSAGFDWYTAFLSDAVPHGHMGLAQELLALGAPVGVWGLASAAGSTGRVGMAQWAVGVIRQEQEKEAAAAAAAAAGMGSGTGGASAADIRPPPSPPPPLPQQQLLQQEQQKKGARSSSAEAAAQAASVAEGGGGQPQVEGQEESIVTDGNREVLECMLKYSLGSGSLELVRWLRARGVPWGACVLHYAAESGNEALVEWMVQLGYDVEQDRNHPREADSWWSPYLAAARQGDMATLRCLRRVGYPTPAHDRTLLHAVRAKCGLEVLQWMVDSGFPVCWQEVEEADREGRPAWRRRWSERSVWVHGMWQWAQAQARAGEQRGQ